MKTRKLGLTGKVRVLVAGQGIVNRIGNAISQTLLQQLVPLLRIHSNDVKMEAVLPVWLFLRQAYAELFCAGSKQLVIL